MSRAAASPNSRQAGGPTDPPGDPTAGATQARSDQAGSGQVKAGRPPSHSPHPPHLDVLESMVRSLRRLPGQVQRQWTRLPLMDRWAAIPAAMDRLQSVTFSTLKAERFFSPSTPDGYPHESRYPHP